MGKGPGLFSDIGKKSKDLLYKDYHQDHKITITTESETGLTFITTGVKKGDLFFGDIVTKLKKRNVTTDIKLDTNSRIFTTVTVDEIAPGLKTAFSFTIPDPNSGKMEAQYLHDNASLQCSVGMTAVPVVEVNGAFGNGKFVIGGEVAFDTNTGLLTKYNTGASIFQPDFTASVLLMDKCDTVKALYVHNLSSNKLVAAEIAHKLSKNENTFTIGSSYALDGLTIVKTRVNNYGMVAGLIQHEWRPRSTVSLSAEVDSKALDKQAKVGLALALSP